MDYYDWNFQNPTVNGTQLVKSGKLNPEIGLNDTSLIAGTSIVVEKTAEGKIKISASSSGPSAPTGYLTVASPKTGLFTYTIGGDASGNVNVYYQGSATAEKVMMGTSSTFSKTFTRSSSAGTVFQDDNQKITLFRCDGQEVTSADVSNNIYMKELSLYNNRLTSIDVDNLADLEYLNVINNSISSIDISNNTKLESIFVGGNPISSLNIATPVALVKHIDIRSTEIKSFDFSPYTNLVTADISGTSISSFSCHSPNLVSVGVYNSPVNSINITAGRLGNNGVASILTSIETFAPILGVEPGTIIITGQQEYVIGGTLYFSKKRLEENGWTVVLDPYEELLYREMSTPTGMTSDSNASWEISASSTYSGNYIYSAFDGNDQGDNAPIWHSNSGSPQWIQWKAVGENPNVLIKDLYLMSDTVSGNTLWYPIDFELQGSNDGEHWETLLSVTGKTDWREPRWTYKRFQLPNNEKMFTYHRIYASSNNGYCSFAEIKAYPTILETPL